MIIMIKYNLTTLRTVHYSVWGGGFSAIMTLQATN